MRECRFDTDGVCGLLKDKGTKDLPIESTNCQFPGIRVQICTLADYYKTSPMVTREKLLEELDNRE